MGRRCYVFLRRRHDVPIRCCADVLLRRLGDVPPRRRWVFNFRRTCDVAGTYRETSLRCLVAGWVAFISRYRISRFNGEGGSAKFGIFLQESSRWEFSGWEYSGQEFSWVGIFLVRILWVGIMLSGSCPGGSFPGGSYPGGNCPGENFPGWNCPRTLFSTKSHLRRD